MTDLVRSENAPKWGLFGDEFDNLFEGFLRPMHRQGSSNNDSLIPAVDVSENESKYVVKADLPGIDKDDIHVSINDGVLTINAETRSDTEDKDKTGRIIRRERSTGKYVRSMRLGREIDEKNVDASFKDGVLMLSLPKAEEAKPKKIKVKVS